MKQAMRLMMNTFQTLKARETHAMAATSEARQAQEGDKWLH